MDAKSHMQYWWSGVTRRMSLTHKPHAYTLATTAMAGLTGLASTAPPALRNRGRRMSSFPYFYCEGLVQPVSLSLLELLHVAVDAVVSTAAS